METNPINTPLAPAHGQNRAGALELIPPCGGRLINLLVPTEARRELADFAGRLPSLQLTARALCDLELLATGAFSPLDRFLGRASYERVLEEMRLADGSLWPIPVTLNVSESALPPRGDWVALRDAQNNLIAAMRIEEAFACDVREEARQVLQTVDSRHPLVAEMSAWGKTCISGELRVLALPRCYDFPELRLTPVQVRERLLALGRRDVVAFQTRNPLHRAHEVMTQRAAASVDGSLLLHPVVGLTRDGDVDYSTRVRIYRTVAEKHYDASRTLLSLLPLAMRMAGPREALWHALIRRNYGANHLIVGRDHAGPGLDSASHPFYPPYAAQELVRRHEVETGVKEITFHELAYLPDTNEYKALDEVPAGTRALTLSGTQVRHDYLVRGVPLPEWFTRPETAAILQDAYPPRHQQGFCVWFTGLSGSGKSTTAHILTVLLQAHGRQVTVLDGDVVRTHLSKGLGFSREDRDANILRIGFVAAEIVRHHGVVICAAVSPYRAVRDQNRRLIGSEHFIEVFMNTPLEVCETRDAKGLYAKARRGEIKGFTGIDDPYEEPLRPEVRLETVDRTPEENARRLLRHLVEAGFIRPIEASQTASPPELTGGNGGQL